MYDICSTIKNVKFLFLLKLNHSSSKSKKTFNTIVTSKKVHRLFSIYFDLIYYVTFCNRRIKEKLNKWLHKFTEKNLMFITIYLYVIYILYVLKLEI